MAHVTEQESKPPGLKLQILEAVLIAIVLLLQYLLWIAEDGVRQTEFGSVRRLSEPFPAEQQGMRME